ncbi:MmgE/PrpD family protein [Pseudotabrizicola sp. 4114]|uniref:MmgE/PrpD family protein n=1 Tax=Pseudotabrizicola sp. 4114 TaxID=2817731 RepID=UPI0028609D38|nr:2-methylcitrate dehydratase PrpD [Pseudorhodobacter sp. 4114]
MTFLAQILDLAAMPSGEIPASARSMARFSLFDWLVCGRAGVSEPLAVILRDYVGAEGGLPAASVFGGTKAPARAAALVNGATSHALDYDDTHFGHVGHPSVAIYPAALAVGEEVGASAADVADAFLIGAEASVRIGMVLGAGHYNRGFHQTATAGAFGATVAAGRLYGLTRDQIRVAIGLCATRASGLKSQFGTMGKPYNAGIAASNGIECAGLARAGFTSADDGLMGAQGFVLTHADAPQPSPPVGTFLFEDVKYKLHACCHGTHAIIEALSALKRAHNLTPGRVASIHLRTGTRWLSVCDIKAPRTGLEIKFSYNWLAGMVLAGISTASDRAYTDTLAQDDLLADFAAKITVEGDAALTDMQVVGEVQLKDGGKLPFAYDLAARLPDAVLENRLRAKATGLIGADGEQIWAMIVALDSLGARDLGKALR